MITDTETFWNRTLGIAGVAIGLAGTGLTLNLLQPGAAPLLAGVFLAGSFVATAFAFIRIGIRVRRLELENEGLIEELTVEFDRLKDRLEIFSEALDAPRTVELDEIERLERESTRRVSIK